MILLSSSLATIAATTGSFVVSTVLATVLSIGTPPASAEAAPADTSSAGWCWNNACLTADPS